MIPSETLSPANSFLFIRISNNFSTSLIICDLCLVRTVNTLDHLFIFVNIDFAIANWVARSETWTPFSCFGYLHLSRDFGHFFFFILLLSLPFFGPMEPYLIIYTYKKKTTPEWNSRESKAEATLSSTDTPSLHVHLSWHHSSWDIFFFYLFRKFVSDESHSWPEVPLFYFYHH